MIQRLSPEQAATCMDQLAALLQDAVANGASVGFLPPLEAIEARRYWDSAIAAIRSSSRIVLVAQRAGQLVGTVQLDLARMPNGGHRAEVVKLLVQSRSRRQGIGRALMRAIEDEAREAERSLLVLDTRLGDAAEQLYLKLGYQRSGVIPKYARGADGQLHDTVILYKQL